MAAVSFFSFRKQNEFNKRVAGRLFRKAECEGQESSTEQINRIIQMYKNAQEESSTEQNTIIQMFNNAQEEQEFKIIFFVLEIVAMCKLIESMNVRLTCGEENYWEGNGDWFDEEDIFDFEFEEVDADEDGFGEGYVYNFNDEEEDWDWDIDVAEFLNVYLYYDFD